MLLLSTEKLRLLSTLSRVLVLLLIRSLNALHDCMCECSSCGLNSFPHCLHTSQKRCSVCSSKEKKRSGKRYFH
jgi:hypothetical protein